MSMYYVYIYLRNVLQNFSGKKNREQSINIVIKDMLFNHSNNALVTEGSAYSIQNYFCSLYFHRCWAWKHLLPWMVFLFHLVPCRVNVI